MYRIEVDCKNKDCERLTWRILEYADRCGLALDRPGYRDPGKDDTDVYDFVELDGFDRETFAKNLRKKYKSFRGELYSTKYISQAEKERAAIISRFKKEHGIV